MLRRVLVTGIVVFYQTVVCFVLGAIVWLAIATFEPPYTVRAEWVPGDLLIGIWVGLIMLWNILFLYLAHQWRRELKKIGKKIGSLRLFGRWFLLSLPVYGVFYFQRHVYPLLNQEADH